MVGLDDLTRLLDVRVAVCVAILAFTATFYQTDNLEKAVGALCISATVLIQVARERRNGQEADEQSKRRAEGPTEDEQADDDNDRLVQLPDLLHTADEAAALDRLEALLPHLRRVLDSDDGGALATPTKGQCLLAAAGPVWWRLGLAAEGRARAMALVETLDAGSDATSDEASPAYQKWASEGPADRTSAWEEGAAVKEDGALEPEWMPPLDAAYMARLPREVVLASCLEGGGQNAARAADFGAAARLHAAAMRLLDTQPAAAETTSYYATLVRARALDGLGLVAMREGDAAAALRLHRLAAAAAAEARPRMVAAWACIANAASHAGVAAGAGGDAALGRKCHADARRIRARIGDGRGLAESLALLGEKAAEDEAPIVAAAEGLQRRAVASAAALTTEAGAGAAGAEAKRADAAAKKTTATMSEAEAAACMQRCYRGKLGRVSAVARKVEVGFTSKVEIATDDDDNVLRINQYTMGKILGQGAYGIVYQAKGERVPGEEGEVAVKVLNRSVLKRKKVGKGTALDGVLKEIGVMKKLSHPNCVQLYEVLDDKDKDCMYLVMEFVAGGDLNYPIKRGERVAEATLRGWMRDSVLGLEHLHHHAILHRDIKPENILWDEARQCAKLADFGVSTISEGGQHRDYVRATAGTPAFYAPEMCGDDKTGAKVYSGKAADVWAFGVCLYMWIFHRLPFEAPTVFMLMEAIKEGELSVDGEQVGLEGGAASEELLSLVRGLLAKKPQQRLRLRDLRRDAWMTDGHTTPLPPPVHGVHGGSGRIASGELGERLREAVVRYNASRALEEVSMERRDSGKRFLDDAKPVAAAPPPAAAKPRPRPGMLKRG